jgi:hypothetical protein
VRLLLQVVLHPSRHSSVQGSTCLGLCHPLQLVLQAHRQEGPLGHHTDQAQAAAAAAVHKAQRKDTATPAQQQQARSGWCRFHPASAAVCSTWGCSQQHWQKK